MARKTIKMPVILGPTAVGKTGCAQKIGEELGLEIVSCDSRQIYKYMDIGTAKTCPGDNASVKQWMVDLVEPSENYSAFRFVQDASGIIRDRAAAGSSLMLCGGTGMYFRALSCGLGPQVGADPKVRKYYSDMAAGEGNEAVWERLKLVDPEEARTFHASNLVRAIRALEVFETVGVPFSQLKSRAVPPQDFDFSVIVMDLPRPLLYERINRRVDDMAERGLWSEFCNLRKRGYDKNSPGLRCVGYNELFDVEEEVVDLQTALGRIKQNTRHFAKRQITWLRHQVKGRWVDMTHPDSPASIRRLISDFLRT